MSTWICNNGPIYRPSAFPGEIQWLQISVSVLIKGETQQSKWVYFSRLMLIGVLLHHSKIMVLTHQRSFLSTVGVGGHGKSTRLQVSRFGVRFNVWLWESHLKFSEHQFLHLQNWDNSTFPKFEVRPKSGNLLRHLGHTICHQFSPSLFPQLIFLTWRHLWHSVASGILS